MKKIFFLTLLVTILTSTGCTITHVESDIPAISEWGRNIQLKSLAPCPAGADAKTNVKTSVNRTNVGLDRERSELRRDCRLSKNSR